MQVFTGKGDDGTTGLYFGGRVAKSDPVIEATGDLDEAQSCIGLARAALAHTADDETLVALERDLWIVMAEVNGSQARDKLEAGKTLVTQEMVSSLESLIERMTKSHTMPSEFVVPGQSDRSARLDVARTVVRRAERHCLPVLPAESKAIAYLNRLSTVLWVLARMHEDVPLSTRSVVEN